MPYQMATAFLLAALVLALTGVACAEEPATVTPWAPPTDWPTPAPESLPDNWPTPPQPLATIPKDYNGLCEAIRENAPIWVENLEASQEIPDPRDLPENATPLQRRHPILTYADPFNQQFEGMIDSLFDLWWADQTPDTTISPEEQEYREKVNSAASTFHFRRRVFEPEHMGNWGLTPDGWQVTYDLSLELTRCWPEDDR